MAFLNCEMCVKLWAEYEAAAKTDRDSVSPNTRNILEPILKVIETHESEAHAEVNAAGPLLGRVTG
jgi:hypothetical protein